MNKIREYYKEYIGTQDNFDRFNNEVINMPRDKFVDIGINRIINLSFYFLISKDTLKDREVTYKDILLAFKTSVEKIGNNYQDKRDKDFEDKYLSFDDINVFYNSNNGRLFRHVMGIALFFGLIYNGVSFKDSIEDDEICDENDFDHAFNRKKRVNYFKCKEYFESNEDLIMPIARNNLFLVNAKSNEFIKSLKGIKEYINATTDYRPTYWILKYIEYINRPATDFELSILFGRVDKISDENSILKRAFEISVELPRTKQLQEEHFFKQLEWENENGTFYKYKQSQQPYFKFHTYLLFMVNFDLLKYNDQTKSYDLTNYSKSLLQDELDSSVLDLENLIDNIDNNDNINKELNNLVLYNRDPLLLELAQKDGRFIEKVNFRSLKHPKYDKDNKRMRNQLVAELAKILAGYKCQYKNDFTFRMPDGKYYCEAHHIIHFSGENGPDITDNIVVLGPEAHMCIHHACKEDVENTYLQLVKNGALNIARFENMINIYHYLNKEHIEILFNKKIITTDERTKLLKDLTK